MGDSNPKPKLKNHPRFIEDGFLCHFGWLRRVEKGYTSCTPYIPVNLWRRKGDRNVRERKIITHLLFRRKKQMNSAKGESIFFFKIRIVIGGSYRSLMRN
jgi:hypothetical protein